MPDFYNALDRLPFVSSNMRIGLLGGSFNPPHEGHREVSLNLLKQLDLDQIWWLVSPGNPLKSHTELLSLNERLQLCEAFTAHPKLKVTGFEVHRPNAYTVETLTFLKKRFPSTYFVWIMGADNLVHFHKWKHWHRLFATFPIGIHDRPGYRYQALASRTAHWYQHQKISAEKSRQLAALKAPAWAFLPTPLYDISSTQIRKLKKHT